MVRGRPREPNERLCPNPECRKPGSPFGKYVPRNNSTDLYFYPWFRHEDGSKDCNLNKIFKKHKSSVKILSEYADRRGIDNKVTDFHYYHKPRHDILKEFPIKEAHISKAWPVVIYHLNRDEAPNLSESCPDCDNRLYYIHDLRCTICNNTTVMWCPKCQCHSHFSKVVDSYKINVNSQSLRNELEKSNIQVVELKDINWFLTTSNKITKHAHNFLKRLSKMQSKINMIITYGDNASKNADRISTRYNCECMYFTDKYGILDKLKKKIDMRKTLSDSGRHYYDNPRRILAD